MKSRMRLIAAAALLLAACSFSVNKNVDLPDGTRTGRGFNTVNGSIRLGADCSVRGECRSVNGSIDVGARTRVGALKSVNGSVSLAADAEVERSVAVVNGGVRLDAGARVRGDVKTINGRVDLDSASIGKNVVTFNGDIRLDRASLVWGDVRIKRSKNGNRDRIDTLFVEIAGGSVLKGGVTVERDPQIEVRVVLSGGGRVEGPVRGAEVVNR
jgi:hypothetical protein